MPETTIPDNRWHTYKQLAVHKDLFTAGIILVKPDSRRCTAQTLEDFSLNNRHLSLSTAATDHAVVIKNKNRRKEVFKPMFFGEQNEFGIYAYSWRSNKDSLTLMTGVDEYVTAIRLFENNLRGYDQHGVQFPLREHNLRFFTSQKIQEILYHKDEVSPYEELLLSQIYMLASLINKQTAKDAPKKLKIHVPWLDYILFGIELFICGRMTRDALDALTNIVLFRKNYLQTKISVICEENNVQVQFESPFDNLIQHNDRYHHQELIEALLSLLQLPTAEVNPNDLSTEEDSLRRKLLERNCITILCRTNNNVVHLSAWAIVAKSITLDTINNMDALRKLANTVFILMSALGKTNASVCSILPLCDKQIQVSYAKLTKTLSAQIPVVSMLTVIEPLNGYSSAHSGNHSAIYKYDHIDHYNLGTGLQKGLLKQAIRNVLLFSAPNASTRTNLETQPTKIEELLIKIPKY